MRTFLSRVGGHINPALIIALLALFIAMGGTGYAISQLPKNSVGNKQLRANAVTSKKVKNGSLTSKDFKKGTLLKGATGAQGPAGPQGPAGSGGSGSPSGAAGGDLAGTYPDPSLKDGSVTASKLALMPYAVVGLNANVALNDNPIVFTTVSWTLLNVGSSQVWTAAQPTRLTAPKTGLYEIGGQVGITGNANGRRIIRIDLNGDSFDSRSVVANVISPGVTTFATNVSRLVQLDAGDYYEMKVLQDSNAALNLLASSAFPSGMSLRYVGPAA